jgi:molecular chaperone GrpE
MRHSERAISLREAGRGTRRALCGDEGEARERDRDMVVGVAGVDRRPLLDLKGQDRPMTRESDPEFDAVAAVAELDEAVAEAAATPRTGDQADRYVALLEAEIGQLQALLAQKDQLLERAGARADQAHAEIEATRRRLAADSDRELEQRTRALLRGFLDVVDDLDRAIEATRKLEHDPEVLVGVELVRRELLAHLGQLGVAHVPALGEPFDARHHEAMAVVPVTDAAQDGRVVGVLREGYAVGEDPLRPAGVAVGKLT